MEVKAARFEYDASGVYPLAIIEFEGDNIPDATINTGCGQWLNYRAPGYVWLGDEFATYLNPVTVHPGTKQEMTFGGLTDDPIVVAIATLLLETDVTTYHVGPIYEKGQGFLEPYEAAN